MPKKDEFGVPIETIVHVLKKGGYCMRPYYYGTPDEEGGIREKIDRFYPNLEWLDDEWIWNNGLYMIRVKDYGKKWALTREELENVKY